MADYRRPTRPSAARAKETFAGASSEEEDGGRPTRSSRRQARLDLSKLDIASLHRYRRFYKLGDVPATATKEDLVPAVSRHFSQQVVEEEEVLLKFVLAVQRHNKQQQQQRYNQAVLLKQQQQFVAQQHQLAIHHLPPQYQYRPAPPPPQLLPGHFKGGVIKATARR